MTPPSEGTTLQLRRTIPAAREEVATHTEESHRQFLDPSIGERLPDEPPGLGATNERVSRQGVIVGGIRRHEPELERAVHLLVGEAAG